jgi:hypothetical protein
MHLALLRASVDRELAAPQTAVDRCREKWYILIVLYALVLKREPEILAIAVQLQSSSSPRATQVVLVHLSAGNSSCSAALIIHSPRLPSMALNASPSIGINYNASV